VMIMPSGGHRRCRRSPQGKVVTTWVEQRPRHDPIKMTASYRPLFDVSCVVWPGQWVNEKGGRDNRISKLERARSGRNAMSWCSKEELGATPW
jgi:hypothetical protein